MLAEWQSWNNHRETEPTGYSALGLSFHDCPTVQTADDIPTACLMARGRWRAMPRPDFQYAIQ
jgi:hypothetical protein